MATLTDLTGRQFGRLTVLARGDDWTSPTSTARQVRWICRCTCGSEVLVLAASLRRGTKSCGCLVRDLPTTHGMYGTPTYLSWAAMIARCTRPRHKKWSHYGGRGITICDRWRDFPNFLADMGERPAGHTLDRIDVDGNYEPGNCRWATPTQQRSNRRDSTNNHSKPSTGETHS